MKLLTQISVRGRKCQDGQALVILLFYMIIAITLTSASVAMVMSNSLSVTRAEESGHALEAAEAGAENALIQMLRNTGYIGETLTLGDASTIVTVTGGGAEKTITSAGSVSGFTRTIQVTVSTVNGVLTVTSWQEI